MLGLRSGRAQIPLPKVPSTDLLSRMCQESQDLDVMLWRQRSHTSRCTRPEGLRHDTRHDKGRHEDVGAGHQLVKQGEEGELPRQGRCLDGPRRQTCRATTRQKAQEPEVVPAKEAID